MKDHRLRAHQPLAGHALLGQWITRHRMTQAEAADQIGISRVQLNQYLTETARPSLEIAIRIEDTTGIGMRLWLVSDGDRIAGEMSQKEDSEVNNNHTNRTHTGIKQ